MAPNAKVFVDGLRGSCLPARSCPPGLMETHLSIPGRARVEGRVIGDGNANDSSQRTGSPMGNARRASFAIAEVFLGVPPVSRKPRWFSNLIPRSPKMPRTSGVGRNTVFKVEGFARRGLWAIIKDSDLDPCAARSHARGLDRGSRYRSSRRGGSGSPDGKPAGVVEGGILQAVSRVAADVLSAEHSAGNSRRCDGASDRAQHPRGDVALPAGVSFGRASSITLATVKAPRDVAAATAEDEAADTKGDRAE